MKTIIITGMPRSGTSWLGQIINSDPKVLFRTEPLFSYRFKNLINPRSSCNEVNSFLANLIHLDDNFILQKENEATGYYPMFNKEKTNILSFKTTRHFELLEKYLKCVPNINIVAVIRHPCGAINSWIKTYNEFQKKGCEIEADWKTGGMRKNQIGEYWGFDDWITSTKFFFILANAHKNFHIVKYSNLVKKPEVATAKLFYSLGLHPTSQTMNFLNESHGRHDANPYSVFKNKSVLESWRNELSSNISNTILAEASKAGLSEFLE